MLEIYCETVQIVRGDSEEDSGNSSRVDEISILLTWIDDRGSQICGQEAPSLQIISPC